MAQNNDCPICLEPPTNPAMTPCTHVFCRRCIGSWLDSHSACPVCRHRITRGRRALVTVRPAASPARRAISVPPRPSAPMASSIPVRSRPSNASTRTTQGGASNASSTRTTREEPYNAPASHTTRGGPSNASSRITRSSTLTTREGPSNAPTTRTSRGGPSNATSTLTTPRPVATASLTDAVPSAPSRCTYRCTVAERREYNRHRVPCSCMRAHLRANRLAAVDISPPTTTTTTTRQVTQTRSNPASRRNSSSSSDELIRGSLRNDDNSVLFERQLERALIASVESASATTSPNGSPLDEATRKAIAESLAEARATPSSSPSRGDAATASTAAAAASGGSSTANPGHNNAFLSALGVVLNLSGDEDLEEGPIEDLLHHGDDDRPTRSGAHRADSPFVATMAGIASVGTRLMGFQRLTEEDSVQVTVSIGDVKNKLRDLGVNVSVIESLGQFLRRYASS